jgi:hypothetical protein
VNRFKSIVARWGSNPGQTDDVRLDSVSTGLVTITDDQRKMNDANHYFIKTFVETTGASSTSEFMFTTPNTSTRIHAKALIASSGDYVIEIFEGTTTSADGTPVTRFNNDRDSSNTSELLAFGAPTVTADGTLMWATRIGSGSPVGSAGVSSEFSYKIIAKTNTKYLFRVTKQDTGDGYVDFDFFWFENVADH